MSKSVKPKAGDVWRHRMQFDNPDAPINTLWDRLVIGESVPDRYVVQRAEDGKVEEFPGYMLSLYYDLIHREP